MTASRGDEATRAAGAPKSARTSARAVTREMATGAAASSPPETIEAPAPPADAANAPDLKDPSLYINRELSLLKFQERVLEEARDVRNPLLERLKFLGILGSNLGEFFMVRIAGLKQQVAAGVNELSPDGRTPAQVLELSRAEAFRLMREARTTYSELLPHLDEAGIHIVEYERLDPHRRELADAFFEETVFPVLTPLAFDPGRPFPHISNMSLNLAVLLREAGGDERFARVKIPKTLPRLVPLPGAGESASHDLTFVWLEQLIGAHLDTLFPGMEIQTAHPFRVTRDAEMTIQEMEADDLLETIEQGVRRRRFGGVVRVTIDNAMPERIRAILIENLDVDPADVLPLDPPLGMSSLWGFYGLDRPDLKDPPFVPAVSPALADPDERDLFAAIREHDILLHHPYDSFEPVVQLLRQAAQDPGVLAIKMTLYRVGRNAPVVHALLDAARNGKEVAVLVELKARFDEESNIEWARALEREGVHVVSGLLGLKTHSKIALIVRREGERIRRYLHVGTGNYNVLTALQYTDLGLLTCDEAMGTDASVVFNFLTGYAAGDVYERFLVAPVSMRADIEELVRREMEHARAGRGGHLIFKMNALVDQRMIRLLYAASQAGVKIELLVRGICCLRPGVPGVSDTVTETSIVGRFLEHSRIYYFANAGDPTVLLGSADLMPRNLNRRVEVLFPVRDAAIIARLRDEILATYLADTAKARRLLPSGEYVRVAPAAGEEPLDSQAWFLAKRVEEAPYPKKTAP
jgi:polyphosphate kinase